MFSASLYITTKREAKHIIAPTKPTTVLEELLGGGASAAAPPGPAASAVGASAGALVAAL